MYKVLDIVAKVLSVVLYPLFVPTYGIALFCAMQTQHTGAPIHWIWITIAIVGTLLLTCILPISAIWILMKQGKVKDLQIEDASERTMPYIYAFMGFVFWCYLMIQVLHAPRYLCAIAIGATVAIGIVALINRRWKISEHLTGIGGLVGGVFCYCLGIGAIPTIGTLVLWLGLSWILMWARLDLHAHTSAQVCAGWLLGMSCTFLPYWILSYAA